MIKCHHQGNTRKGYEPITVGRYGGRSLKLRGHTLNGKFKAERDGNGIKVRP